MHDPLHGAMDAVKPDGNCRAFNLSFKVPDEMSSEVDDFFKNHKTFMDETHPVDFGDDEPMVLFYTVTKTPELKDGNDPSKGTTGNTLYALTEIYRGLDGCEAHMTAGKNYQKDGKEEDHGPLFAKFLDVVEKYATATVMMAPVIAAMHD